MAAPRLLGYLLLALVAGTEPRPALGEPASHDADPSSGEAGAPTAPDAAGRPHLLRDGAAGVVVRVHGSAMCSGTPISGTSLVVTAAHCVLDREGEISRVPTVTRDGVEHDAVSVLVDRRYRAEPGPRFDAAVIDIGRPLPGPSARLGDRLAADASVTIAGLQPLDADGSLFRGTSPHDLPEPPDGAGPVVEIGSAPAGCVHAASEVEVAATRIDVPCGLIPGASGGGLYVDDGGELVLVGIISTIAYDLTSNGVTPVAAAHELLRDPERYLWEMAPGGAVPGRARAGRS